MFTRLLKTILTVIGISFLLPNLSTANSGNESTLGMMSFFDKMSQDDVVEITIKTELDSLIENRNSKDYRPATFSLKQGKSSLNFDMKVKTRGKFRRRVCDFPPLKLKFSKEDLAAAGFSAYNKMKLVTHCLDDKELSRETIMREYLTYELYREVTENSFRVQLAKLIYIDSNSGKKTKRWGFLIESTKEMAARLGAVEVEKMGQEAEAFDLTAEKISSTFNYLIGNEDYNLEMNKNVKFIQKHGSDKLIPVPYDFDFSDLVNAPYARFKSDPNKIAERQRVYMGLTPDRKDLHSTHSFYKTKKESLIKKVYKFHLLSEGSKKEIVSYLKSFYDLIDAEPVSVKHIPQKYEVEESNLR